MAQPRYQLVDIQKTPYYHVMSRCVRRAYLCGYDKVNQKSYEHRRKWIEERIRLLSSLFAIEVCAYAVMRNHYHIVVKICPDKTFDWSQNEVVRRWSSLFSIPFKTDKYGRISRDSIHSQEDVSSKVELYRNRLSCLSWFMRCINERLARQANREDDVTGHFWESRFKSQALNSEAALLACMVYVDLNPLRAQEASTPDSARYTSYRQRVSDDFNFSATVTRHLADHSIRYAPKTLAPLALFRANGRSHCSSLPVTLPEYTELILYTQRKRQSCTSKSSSPRMSAVFNRLKVSSKTWKAHTNNFEKSYQRHWKHLKSSRHALSVQVN